MASPKLCAVESCGKPSRVKINKPPKHKTRTIHKLKPLDVMRLDAGKRGDGAGLWLMKTRKDAGYWALRYQIDGKSHEMGIGSIHTFSLAEARERAKNLRKKLKDGIDPLQDRRAAKARRKIEAAAAVTFREFAEEYIENHRAEWTSAKHAQQWTQTLSIYAFPIIGNLPIGAVDIDAVKAVFSQPIDGKTFWAARAETASRVRARIETVLDAATAIGKRTGDNPAGLNILKTWFPARSKIEKGQEKHHDAMPYSEVPAFMAKLRAQDDIASRALEFCILTAARVGEIQKATWGEIDIENKVRTILAIDMKTRTEPHKIPLSDRAIEILKAVKGDGDKGENDRVFPGRGAPISDRVLRARLLANYSGPATVHGFRSSFTDWAAECTDHPNDVVELALAHKVGNSVQQAYRRSKLFDRRRLLMADWCAFCAGATGTVLKFAIVG